MKRRKPILIAILAGTCALTKLIHHSELPVALVMPSSLTLMFPNTIRRKLAVSDQNVTF